MASIRKYKTAKGHAWRVQYRSPDGKSRTKQGFRTKDEAQKWSDLNNARMHRQEWLDPDAGKVTIGELAEQWMSTRSHMKPSTLEKSRTTLRVHIIPKWGHREVRSLKPSEIQQWVSEDGRTPSTVERSHSILAQILDDAVRDELIRANPARGLILPKQNPPRRVYLSAEQLAMLAEESGEHAPIVWLLGTVGLRWGELAGLQVQDVNVLKRRITIQRNAVDVAGKIYVGTPKTGKSRTVAVAPFVMDMLVPLMDGKRQDDWIWTDKNGNPLQRQQRYGWMDKAVKRCMAKDESFPRVTPHGLRHVAAGLMISSGAHPKVVQRQLGHASAAMTLDTYADLWDEDLDAVATKLDEGFSRVVGLSWNG